MAFIQTVCMCICIAYALAQSPEVETKNGKVQGMEITYKSKTLTKFLGIPFAKPPVGSLRFMKPQPMEKWNDVKVTKKYSDSCMEYFSWLIIGMDAYNQSEDCLYLNIFVPGNIATVKTRPRAVMFWIYGGGWTLGNANTYDANNLAVTEDVIVVTSNYRLGLFGFMSSDDDVIPGNVGLFDQHAALAWVNQNIAAFGGDVSKITIFGESAGADSVYNHFVSPLSNFLFSRAIIESTPSIKYLPTKKEQAATVKTITKKVCPSPENSEELLKCLQDLSAEEFLEVSNSAVELSYYYGCVDGDFLPDQPIKLMLEGAFNKSKEVIIGYTSDDGDAILTADQPNYKKMITSGVRTDELQKNHIPTIVSANFPAMDVPNRDMISNLIYQKYFSCDQEPLKLSRAVFDMYTDSVFASIAFDIAYYISMHGGKVYIYEFEHMLKVLEDQLNANMDLYAGHSSDIYYVFGLLHKYEEAGMEITDNEYKLSMSIMKAFAEFARTGSPKYLTHSDELAEWSPYTIMNKKYLKFTERMSTDSNQMVPDSLSKTMDFWNKVIPMIQHMDTCDALVINKDGSSMANTGTRECGLKLVEMFLLVIGAMMLCRGYYLDM